MLPYYVSFPLSYLSHLYGLVLLPKIKFFWSIVIRMRVPVFSFFSSRLFLSLLSTPYYCSIERTLCNLVFFIVDGIGVDLHAEVAGWGISVLCSVLSMSPHPRCICQNVSFISCPNICPNICILSIAERTYSIKVHRHFTFIIMYLLVEEFERSILSLYSTPRLRLAVGVFVSFICKD